MPIEFFLPDRLVQQLTANYHKADAGPNKGLLFTVDFVQDVCTNLYGATGTVAVAVGKTNGSGGVPIVDGTMQILCPHPPPCG